MSNKEQKKVLFLMKDGNFRGYIYFEFEKTYKYKVGVGEVHGFFTPRLSQEGVNEMIRLFEIEKEKCMA